MKPIVPSPAMHGADRKSYAVWRMHMAASRLLRAVSVAEEIQAGYWVLAWAVAAGARPSARDLRTAMNSMAAMDELRLH